MADPNTQQVQQQPDEYSTPIPQGASAGSPASSGQDEYSTPIPQGAQALPGHPTATMTASNPHSLVGAGGTIGHTNDESVLSTMGKDAANAVSGFGQGLYSTLSGFNDMIDKHFPGDHNEPGRAAVRDTLHNLAGKDQSMSDPAQQAGYGGETLLEFLGGDEALKVLSMPERLAQMAQSWKIIEKSPRLMSALKFGTAALKGGAALSPEEAAVVAKYPKLSALVNIGHHAVQAGTVQGAQTLVRTGGDVGAAAKDAAGAAATVGVLHGGTKAAAHVLGKGAQAAQTIEEMTARGASAPSAADVGDQFKNTVNDAFGKETGTLQNNLDDATSTIQMAGQGAPSQQSITAKAQKLVSAQRKSLSDDYVGGLKKLSALIDADPENPTTIPYEGSPLHETAKGLVAEGLTQAGPLDEALQKTRPGSPRANRTLDMLSDLTKGEEGDEEAGGGAHGLLDDFVKNGETAPEDGHPGAEGGEPSEGTPISLQQLTEYRRVLGERMRNLGYTSADDNADRQIYKKLIQGVDDTIAHLADMSAEVPGDVSHTAQGEEPLSTDAEARNILQYLRTQVAKTPGEHEWFDWAHDPTVEMHGSGDVQDELKESGMHPAESIRQDLIYRFGQQAQEMAQDQKGLPAYASDMKKAKVAAKLADKLEALELPDEIPQPKKVVATVAPEEDFSPEEGDEDAPTTAPGASGTQARQLLDQMNTKYRNGIRLFQNADVKSLLKGNVNDISKKLMAGQTSLDDINAVKKVIGPESFKQLGDSSLQNMIRGAVDDSGDLDYKKLFKQWQGIKDPNVRKAMFGDTGDALSKALQTAVGASSGIDQIGKTVQSLLGNGDINSAVRNVDQMRKLSNTIGPDGMKTIGQSMLEQQIGEASTRLDPNTGLHVADRFNPDKVLDWWNGFKDQPEVRDMLFHPDPASKKQYADLMQRLAQASSVKKLVKLGLLPATVGTAGVIHGTIPALVAAVAGLGDLGSEKFGSARGILDHIANNPRTWKLVGGLGKMAQKADTAPAANTAKKAAYNVMKSASQALGSDADNQGNK